MSWTLFFIFLAASGAATATSVMFKPGAWYEALAKPDWTPPKWAFPVVWTTLYILMAWAASRVAPLSGAGLAMALFALQVTLNTLWTPAFFGAHRIGLGAGIIGLLWLTVAAMMVQFWRLDAWAGVMILPYIAWLTVAASLNIWIWRNNPLAGAAPG